MGQTRQSTTTRARLSFRVPAGWREAVREWCGENGVAEVELFRRATRAAYGWSPGSPADDTMRHGRPPEASVRPSPGVTWDMSQEDLARLRAEAASLGLEAGRALMLAVDSYIGRPWEIMRRLASLDGAARLIGRRDVVRSLERLRARLEAGPASDGRKN